MRTTVVKNKKLPFFALALCGLFAAGLFGGCTTQAFCAKQKECASDPPGEEFERICAIEVDGFLRQLRANKEEECHKLADAYVAHQACLSQMDCDDYRDCVNSGDPDDCRECEDSRRDLDDAWDDADDECSARD
jgi:hypothetical protein